MSPGSSLILPYLVLLLSALDFLVHWAGGLAF